MRRRQQKIEHDGWAFWCLMGLLAWAPLPLASNRTWALGLLSAAMLALLAAVCVASARRGEALLDRLGVGRWPLALLFAYAGWIGLQYAGVLPGIATADRFNSLQYLLGTLMLSAAFALVLLLARSERRLRWLLGTILVVGLVQALIAILLFASQAEHIYLFMHYQQGTRAMGTFANFDHLAGFMELCIAAGVGLMLAHMGSGEQRRSNRRQKLVAALKFMMSGKMLVRLMLVIMVITLVLTRSRMGNAAFFSSLMIVGGLAMLSNPRLRKGAFWLVLSLIVVDVIIVGQWVGIDHVVERLQNTSVRTEHARGEESLEQRAQTPYLALGMVRERPVAGFGAGSFYTVFPRFKSADKEAYWDYAHNDYVQIAAETGLVGLGLLAGVVLMTIGRIMLLWRAHESRFHRGLAFGSAMAICALLIHSWVDFNLQMPANALVFCVLLAVMWALVPRPPRGSGRSSAATQVSPDPA
ncbi:O-antigen ligase family protein [Uliginosibacterium paludis]|uniref:O-antigen ligase family protein n=1 Tax=Uliginosibacterium paludis TaxID=1615952 RepID=A0ABV2CUU4_9RHOO